ncbi:MAG: hypothetical protein R3B54_17720 [Bdellovibrionota bacterium]
MESVIAEACDAMRQKEKTQKPGEFPESLQQSFLRQKTPMLFAHPAEQRAIPMLISSFSFGVVRRV